VISRTTRISATILRNIESNHIEKLPAPVFLRGFLAAYAREVGLNPEETVRDYLRQFRPPAQATEGATPETSEVAPEATSTVQDTRNSLDTDRSRRLQWVLIAGIVAAAVVGQTVNRWRASGPIPPADSVGPNGAVQPSLPAPTGAGARSEIATAGSRDTNAGTAIDGDVLRVEIHPQALCWLSATVDGERVVYRLMRPGEQQLIEIHDQGVLRVGDAAAFAFSINNAQGRSVGLSGEPVTLHITKQNYRGFLRTPTDGR
jgi:cytoskeletal protein RodZ